MNVRPKLKDGSDNPLAKVKVRQALNYAIDKDGDHQDRHLRRRHADGLLHVLGHAAASGRRAGLPL